MKILLFGDIASGKTTISKLLKKRYSDFEIIAIDDFRCKFGDYTMKGENIALKKFISKIEKVKNQIIEASGVGKLGVDIYSKISEFEEDVLVIILHMPVNIINERIKNRNWNIPFPGKQNKLNNIISQINKNIQSGEITALWSGYSSATILKTENRTIKKQSFIVDTISNYIKLNLK